MIQTAAWPLTKAERTNYAETSTYEDVVGFLRELAAKTPALRVRFIGESKEGRPIPMAVISWPPVASAAEAKLSGRPVAYIQGNIHAGEVEGKESAQALLRRLCQESVALAEGKRPTNVLVDRVAFVINPIYNADGNEKWGPVAVNRPEQDGPASVGVRANGQGFDLNRDAVKVESPEMSAALTEIYRTWDPDVVMDLHTTDGTRHGFDLTYAPPTNPNTNPLVMRLSRDELIPAVRREFNRAYHQDVFDYGNAVKRNGEDRWETFGFEGRYVTNYVGLRNRIGLLSEATTFIPFKDRVVATDRFVGLSLDYVAKHAKLVLETSRKADAEVVDYARTHPQLGVRFAMDHSRVEDVPIEKPPGKKEKRPDAYVKRRLTVYDRWNATKTARYPTGWIVDESCVKLLRKHGIVVERLEEAWVADCDVFSPTRKIVASNPFQGHRLVTLEGAFSKRRMSFSKGVYYVPGAQPLGILAFNMLEPESTDGVVAWGVLPIAVEGAEVGIYKTDANPSVSRVTVP